MPAGIVTRAAGGGAAGCAGAEEGCDGAEALSAGGAGGLFAAAGCWAAGVGFWLFAGGALLLQPVTMKTLAKAAAARRRGVWVDFIAEYPLLSSSGRLG